ncbi:general substrate transporter [Bisporella sp. PMI_857]|nr:general substrate transporter [Bisporella sp. PMI_857]
MVLSGAAHVDGGDQVTQLVKADTVSWWKKKNLRYLYFLLFPTCMGIEVTSGFDSQLINSLQGVAPWKKYFGTCSSALKAGKMVETCGLRPSLSGIVAASYSLGAICSLPFIPAFNDRFGRRWSIFFGSAVSILGAIIQGSARHVAMYIIARMLLGFGIPFCIISGSAMLGELGYPKERAILTSLFNASYFIGSITAAGITMGTNFIPSDWAWRVPSYLQLVPSLVQLLLIFLLPESPRYLISKDRREEAFDILCKYHAEGDRNNLIVNAEMIQIETTIKLELNAAKLTWSDLFKTAGMRKRAFISMMIGLFTQWSGNTLISYYFFTILGLVGVKTPKIQQAVNLGKEGWSLINAFAIALVITRFKRRKMYLLCTSCMLTVYVCWTICMGVYMEAEKKHKVDPSYPLNMTAGKMVIFFIFLYSPAYNIGFNSLTYTYLVELFPYAERTRGLAFFQFFGRGSNFFATFVNPIGLANISWRWLIVYCSWVLFEIVVVYFFFPETYNRTLEELTFLFEGQELVDQQVIAVEKQIHADPIDLKHQTTEDQVTHIEARNAETKV